ncbi:MAG TPA: T9SS type A sorting domain-containing protein [Chitinophagaceae bacterium]|nr:T9SS type A sorting domain-containing protein [Chitinophagaceae bacterium]
MRKSILLGLFCFCCWTSYGQLQSSIFAQNFGGTDSLALEQSTLSGSDNNMRVKLDWKQEAMKGADYVSVERSSNGRAFEVITVLKQSGTAPLGSWIDEAPSKGTNLYRIRFNMPNGLVIYSRIVMVRVAGDISLKFYPNPVDDILIVRSEQPVDLQIMDASGKVRVQQSQVQGLSLLNVSALEKGIYLLRMQNRAYNLVKQVKLIKN